MYQFDTIAAISTSYGTGGIGIIRISGENSFDIAEKIFKGKKKFSRISSHTINYGKVIDIDKNELIDEVLVSKMEAPNTFTKENIVEINCHGGMIIQKRILELVIKQGARLAEPGEFTKRAFLNGRIDLSQAEAVIDLINSKTNESSKAALNQLEGKLSIKIEEIRKLLIDVISRIEVNVDYPEYDIEELSRIQLKEYLELAKQKLIDISNSFNRGRILREGLNVVILGRPNVGKSSLLNELIGKNKAIVTDIPGTTRDIIEEYINVKGIPVRIIDTAGLRETEDEVEKIGVQRAYKEIKEADLNLIVIDASNGIDQEDYAILENLDYKKTIIIINKIDLVKDKLIEDIESKLGKWNSIRISAKNSIGIDDIENKIWCMFFESKLTISDEILVTNIRHKELIDKSLKNIDEALDAISNNIPVDCITIDVRNAAEHIGEITGHSVNEEVLNEIFSKFCIGK